MDKLKQFEDKLSNRLDRKAYEKAIIDELKRIKESGASKRDIETALAYVREFSKSINKRQIYTANDLTDAETEMARLIRVHQDRGYQPNNKVLDFETMKPYLNQKLKYKNGLNRSLTDAFGEIDTELSNEAFSVYRKGNEKPTVLFRGSRTDPTDRATLQDWKQNASNLFDTAKQTNDFKTVESNLKRVNDKYGGFKKLLGYSKGGGLALHFAKEYDVPFTAFNPHVNGGHDLTKINGSIIRTAADPASIISAFKKHGDNLKIKSVPALIGNEDPLNSHDMNNFWNDTLRRQNHLEIAPKIQANNTMRILKREYEKIDGGIELHPRQLDTAFRQRKLTTTRLDEPKPSILDDYSVEPLRQTRINKVPDNMPQRRLTSTSFTADRADEFGSITDMPKVVTKTRPMKPTNGRVAPIGVQSSQSATLDTAFQPRQLKTTSLDSSFFNPKLISDYKAMTPAIKDATKANLSNRIVSSTNNLDDYAVHYDDSIKSQMFSSVKGGLGTGFKSGVKIGGAGLLGAGLGMGVSELANVLHLDGNNPYVNSALTGTLVGGLTEGAGLKMAGIGLSTLAGGSRLLTSGLSGGVGALVGTYATQGIENLFGEDANPYVRDIIGNIGGGEIGLGAGLATTASIGAGLSAVAGGELAVAGADFWNPVGWGALVGAGITAIAGGVVGAFEGKQEADAKQAQQDLMTQERKEITYAGSADQLQDQYAYMRTYFTEMGMSPTVIGQLNNDMMTKLQNPNVSALTQGQFEDTFNRNLDQFSIDGFTYSTSQPSNQQELEKRITDMSVVHQSMLNSLVNAMNSHGAGLSPVPDQLYTAKDFATAYNAILASNPSAATKTGIPPLPILADPSAPDLTSSIPTGFDPARTLQAQQDIRDNIAQSQAFKENVLPIIAPYVGDAIQAVGQFGENLAKGIDNTLTTIGTALSDPNTAINIANAINKATGVITPPVVPVVQAQVSTPAPILTGQFTRTDYGDTPVVATTSAIVPVVQAPVVQAPVVQAPVVQAQVSTPAPIFTGQFGWTDYG